MKKYQEPEIELLKFVSQEDILTDSSLVEDDYIGTPDYPIG